MEQTTKVFDMATLTRKDAILIEDFLIHGANSAIISVKGRYFIANQIDRVHGLCYNSRTRETITVYTIPESPHVICRMQTWGNKYFVPAFYDARISYAFNTLDEAKQAIQFYSL